MTALKAQFHAGYYRLRLARGEVPAMIEHQLGLWSTWIDGRRIAKPDRDPVMAGVPRVFHFGERISEAEYCRLIGAPIQVAA